VSYMVDLKHTHTHTHTHVTRSVLLNNFPMTGRRLESTYSCFGAVVKDLEDISAR